MHILLVLSHPSLFGRAGCFGEEGLFGAWILKCCPMGSSCGTGVLLDLTVTLLLYPGVIFRVFRMSALGSQTPSKTACEENCCNLSFLKGRNEVETETFKLPGIVTGFFYNSQENMRVVVEASVCPLVLRG